jgi:D-lactate dehydrogenase (cytochrome)
MGGATAPRVWKEMPTLFFKFSGSKASVRDNINQVQRIAKGNKGGTFEFAKDEKEQKLLWSARKESLWSMLALRKEGEEICKFFRAPHTELRRFLFMSWEILIRTCVPLFSF